MGAIQITPELVTFSKPFSRFFGWFPMGGRSTAIKLSSGDVWVIASTPFSDETRAAIEKLGNVKYILAADADHHFFLCTRILSSPPPSLAPVADADRPFCKQPSGKPITPMLR